MFDNDKFHSTKWKTVTKLTLSLDQETHNGPLYLVFVVPGALPLLLDFSKGATMSHVDFRMMSFLVVQSFVAMMHDCH